MGGQVGVYLQLWKHTDDFELVTFSQHNSPDRVVVGGKMRSGISIYTTSII